MMRTIDQGILMRPGVTTQLTADRATIDELRWDALVVQVCFLDHVVQARRRFVLIKQGQTEDALKFPGTNAVRPLPGRSFFSRLQFTIEILRQRVSQTSQKFVQVHAVTRPRM